MVPAHTLLQNRYQIIRKIGQGGMGAVYEAIDQRLGYAVALKQIIRGDPVVFAREARLLARLRHSALPKVSDHFIDEVGQFLVMDFIPGDDLAALSLRRKDGLTPAMVLAWGDQLLTVLDYLHSQTPPVIHRDIKPANLKLTAQGELILLDFGLAKGKTGETAEAQKSVAGYTLCYAAPEQIRGERTDACSDLYAVAATLYHLMAGHTPPDAIQRTIALANQQPDPLQSWHSPTTALPHSLWAVLYKAMALNPADRFANANAFRTALQTAHLAETGVATQREAPLPAPQLPVQLPHNLPTQLTTLVGRTQEITTLQSWLAREEVRLITLTGAGGSGKTRLALAVAQTFVDSAIDPTANGQSRQFSDGLFFVNLAAIRDANLLISTIAQVLGLKEAAGTPLRETLQAYLRDKKMLLLLDNFEQIIAAAPLVSDLLMACPLVKILVTSRETLRLGGEHEFLVPLLSIPTPTKTVTVGTLAHYAAVELFVQRTQSVKPGFILNEANASMVAEICTRLEGLPLAIELAAARMKLLSPQALLTKLTDRFKLLSAGARDLPDRQRTLQATLDWSYDLLSEDEKTLFRRLAVFVGGCTWEAVETVCNATDDGNLTLLQIDVFDGLTSLLNKSLVYQEAEAENESRFMFLTTIYEYALARLMESGEWDVLRQRHLNYYLVLAEQAKPELKGKNQTAWLNRLETEYNNLRMALQWSNINKLPDIGLRLAVALGHFWEIRAYFGEGCQWLTSMLAQNNHASLPIKAKAFHTAGSLTHSQGDLKQAAVFHQAALHLWRELEDKVGIAYSLNNLGTIAQEQDDYVAARALYEESLTRKRELDDKSGISTSLNNLGNIALVQGDYVTARTLHEESLALKRELDDKWGIAFSSHNLGIIAQAQGDYVAARTWHEESLALSRQLGDKSGIAWALTSLGVVAHAENDYISALSLHEESLTLSQQLGEEAAIAIALHNLASTIRCQGNVSVARSHYRESLLILRELGWKLWIERSFREIALLFLQIEKPTMTAQMFGVAAALREFIGVPIQLCEFAQHKQTVAAVRCALGEEAFTTAWAVGQRMLLDQAIDYALAETE